MLRQWPLSVSSRIEELQPCRYEGGRATSHLSPFTSPLTSPFASPFAPPPSFAHSQMQILLKSTLPNRGPDCWDRDPSSGSASRSLTRGLGDPGTQGPRDNFAKVWLMHRWLSLSHTFIASSSSPKRQNPIWLFQDVGNAQFLRWRDGEMER
jgi:hypothetical protein